MVQSNIEPQLLLSLWLINWAVFVVVLAVFHIAIMRKRLENDVIGASPAKHAIIIAIIAAFLASTAILTAMYMKGLIT